MGIVQTTGFRKEFVAASTTWAITHNLDTSSPVVDVWVDVSGTMTKILPQSVVATSSSVVTITFSSATAGIAFVA